MSEREGATVDPFEALSALLPSLPMVRENKSLGRALSKVDSAAKRVEEQIATLEALVEASSLFSGYLGDTNQVEFERRLRTLARQGYSLQSVADEAGLEEALRVLPEIKGNIEHVVRDLQIAWSARLRIHFAAAKGLGGVLTQIPGMQALGADMLETAKRSAGLAFPPDGDTQQALADLEEEWSTQRAQLAEIGAGEEVERFLLAVAERTANLSLVSPDVLEWLAGNGAAAHFMVRLGA